MKYMGIDYGKKRVGVALSDDTGTMAFPEAVLQNTSTFFDELAALLKKNAVTAVVIGHSKNLDGIDNPIQKEIDVLVGLLRERCDMTVYFEPEFFTTKEAAAATLKKDEKDAAAAAVILNSFLSKHTEVEDAEEEIDVISYDDFAKLDIRIGTIVSVDIVEKADKLLKLQVDFGDRTRQIISGIREFFTDPQVLVGKQCSFIINLEPRTIRGEESQGMILAAQDEAHLALLTPHRVLDPGTKVR